MLAFDLVSHRPVGDDLVAVPASFAMPCEAAGCFEVVDDSLHRPFGDAHLVGKIAESELRITCQADEHVAVVGEKGPASSIDGRVRRCFVDNGSSSHVVMLGTNLPELNFRRSLTRRTRPECSGRVRSTIPHQWGA